MKRRTFLKQTGSAGLVTLITPSSIVHALRHTTASPLEDSFKNPPAIARPFTWWHWMNGNITREGITLDLEAMHRVGIGGVQCFNVGTGIPKGPVDYLSPKWVELTQHAISEAGRLGMEFDMHNCPGWSSTGGPWITPELSMQQVVWSETLVEGGKEIDLPLPKPFVKLDYYRDTYVVAFPALDGENRSRRQGAPEMSSNQGPVDAGLLGSADFSKGIDIHPGQDGQPGFLQLAYPEPLEARSLTLFCAPIPGGKTSGNLMQLQASDDGVSFTNIVEVRRAGNNLEMPAAVSFPATKARYFRLLVPLSLHIAGFRLSGAARILNWPSKANFPGAGSAGTQLNATTALQTPIEFDVPSSSLIDPAAVVDLTGKVNEQGRLNWNAPEGRWVVIRFGHTAIGRKNNAPPESGAGLECDKYSRKAYHFHFEKMFQNLLPALKAILPKAKVGLLVDSYEVGMQNWTVELPREFEKRRGYDFVRYLPALTGRVVRSVETTERFLWDLRQTHADLVADNYHGYFADLCKENGILSYTEPYNNGPFQQMEVGSRVNVNMGEFWIRNPHFNPSVKLASSIAHVFGKRLGDRQIVGAEAYTGEGVHSKWQEHPGVMKAQGDLMYTKGLSRFIFHRYAHQPHPTARPGMTMGPWGFHFDRTNTWFEKGKDWLQYAARCQSLLQQGNFVGDLLYFTGEDVPGDDLSLLYKPSPAPPKGYDYDFVNAKALLTRAEVKNGRILFPDGTSYAILLLPGKKTMTVEVLRRLYALLVKGLVLVGNPPEQTPGLSNYTANEAERRKLVQQIWGSERGPETDRRVGAGRVFSGLELETVLQRLNLQPDFTFSSKSGKAIINYVHRRMNGADVYFVANRMRTPEETMLSFRVSGKKPELWQADTGQISPAMVYETAAGRTSLALPFDPSGSYFVVFRNPESQSPVRAVEMEGKAVAGTNHFPTPAPKRYPHLTNNFTISVWVKPEVEEKFGGIYLYDRGISSNVFYPPEGEKLYGKNHVTCGLVAARNGVAVYERATGYPLHLQHALTPLSGWTHLALVYRHGVPQVYVNGTPVLEGKASGAIVHPGLGDEKEDEFSWFFEGDKSEPELFAEVLSEEQIQQLAKKGAPSLLSQPFLIEPVPTTKGGLLFWQNGRYTLHNQKGQRRIVTVEGAGVLADLSADWEIVFPPNLGAPAQLALPRLMSLHQHPQDGVKYFSGTATYTKTFMLPPNALANDKRLFLHLGRVEVMADISLNGKSLGLLWKPPYRVDITEQVKLGENRLEVEVTNQWCNRLIGDEQLPAENEFAPQGSRGSGIQKLPDWYLEGKPKPPGGRITFTTWKHFQKDSPLLESGLIGPVTLYVGQFLPDPVQSKGKS